MECCLAQGELIRLEGEKNGVILRCIGGAVWLTCGDSRDYLLTAGRSFALAAGQFAVAEALQAAVCNLAPVHEPCGVTRESERKPAVRFAVC